VSALGWVFGIDDGVMLGTSPIAQMYNVARLGQFWGCSSESTGLKFRGADL